MIVRDQRDNCVNKFVKRKEVDPMKEMNKPQQPMTLAQQFVLLATGADVRAWRKPRSSNVQTYAAGALLFELMSEGVIVQDDDLHLSPVRAYDGGDAAARLMLGKLASSKLKTAKQWAQSLYTHRSWRAELFEAIVKPIVDSGDLQETNGRQLIAAVKRFEPSPAAKEQLVHRIRADMLENGPAARQTMVLSMMLQTGGLLKGCFEEDEVRLIEDRLQSLQEADSEEGQQLRHIHSALKEFHRTVATVTASSIT